MAFLAGCSQGFCRVLPIQIQDCKDVLMKGLVGAYFLVDTIERRNAKTKCTLPKPKTLNPGSKDFVIFR